MPRITDILQISICFLFQLRVFNESLTFLGSYTIIFFLSAGITKDTWAVARTPNIVQNVFHVAIASLSQVEEVALPLEQLKCTFKCVFLMPYRGIFFLITRCNNVVIFFQENAARHVPMAQIAWSMDPL